MKGRARDGFRTMRTPTALASGIDKGIHGNIAGSTNLSREALTVIWRIAITEVDWQTYRRDLADAHLASGTLSADEGKRCVCCLAMRSVR
jgi:hypothetical protein